MGREGAAPLRITAEAVDRGSAHRGCSHCAEEHPTFNRRNLRERSRDPPQSRSLCAQLPLARHGQGRRREGGGDGADDREGDQQGAC